MKQEAVVARQWSGLIACCGLASLLAGCGGNGGSSAPPPPPDTTAPTAALVAPGAAVSRIVQLEASASDNVGVSSVRFLVDGTEVGVDSSAPFRVSWDSSTVADGTHTVQAVASDAAGNTGSSAEVELEVTNERSFEIELAGRTEVQPVETAASGTATLAINVGTGSVAGTLTLTGFAPTAAHIHDGYAGENGPVLIPLEQDGTDPSVFNIPANAMLTIAQVDRLLTGGLYLNAHSARHPGGEVRGQILPAGFEVHVTHLSGRNESPAVDTSATGAGAITVEPASGRAFVHLTLVGLDDATAAHVHRAFAGSNGDVEVGLAQDSGAAAHWFVDDVELDAEQLAALAAGELYLNAHSQAHPGGEVRGQLIPPGIELIAGDLSGTQQVPELATMASGRLFFTLNETSGDYVLHVNTSGVDDATFAHIHEQYAGANGPVVVPLDHDANDIAHWSATGTLDQALEAALRAGRAYVNVHTPANQGGEIRGQLVPATVLVSFDRLEGAQEVPAVTSAGTALAATTFDTASAALTVHLRASGVDDAFASHVHVGYAGENGPVVIGLTQDPEDVGHWSFVESTLTAEQAADLLAGRHYVNLHTPANQGGEIRAQISVPGIEVLFNPMDGAQVVPSVATTASGVAATTVDLIAGSLVARINTTDLAGASSASLNQAPPGENGDIIASFTQDPMNPDHWSLDATTLAESGFAAYGNGELYVTVATATNPDGEIRGQLVPPSAPPPDTTAPTVTLGAPASPLSGTVTLTATANDDVGVTAVRFFAGAAQIGTDASPPYSVSWDTTTVPDGTVTLRAEAEDEAGNVGTSATVDVTVMNAMPVTLAQIQSAVFTPRCSGCHSGPTSGTLPSGMNLSNTTASFNALVGVPSIEVPSIDRVEPNDPGNSYLIQKLEGTAAVGVRMPQGGPFLDEATMNDIRQWITDGAPGP